MGSVLDVTESGTIPRTSSRFPRPPAAGGDRLTDRKSITEVQNRASDVCCTIGSMPSSLNKVMLIGNLGADAETLHTASGTPLVKFRMATSRRFKDGSGEFRETTEWHQIVMWRGDNVAPYLTKGKKVYVEGRLQTRSWEGQDGQKRYQTEVVCESFGLMLLGGREGGSQASYGQPAARDSGRQTGDSYSRPRASSSKEAGPEAKQPAASTSSMPASDDDDIPF